MCIYIYIYNITSNDIISSFHMARQPGSRADGQPGSQAGESIRHGGQEAVPCGPVCDTPSPPTKSFPTKSP